MTTIYEDKLLIEFLANKYNFDPTNAIKKYITSKRSNLFVTRISPNNSDAMNDYDILKRDIAVYNFGHWDKDDKNRMKPGDIWCPIVDKGEDEKLIPYKVVDSSSNNDRLEHWKSNQPYNIGNNGQNSVQHRDIIEIEEFNKPSIKWTDFRRLTGWSPNNDSFRPRGTTRVKNAEPIFAYWNIDN